MNPEALAVVQRSPLGQMLRPEATLDDVLDSLLDRLATAGFDWVWFLGVWQTGAAGRRVSCEHHEWQPEFREILPDFEEQDVCGSCFAVATYTTHSDFGGDSALERLRKRIHQRGMRLLLDFVPNHTALDHRWVKDHPDFYVRGTEEQLQREPQNYIRTTAGGTPTVLAYGRDPYFSGWPDTLQLNYAEPSLQQAMRHKPCKTFIRGYSVVSTSRRRRTASGRYWIAHLLGMATGRGIVSSVLPGKNPAAHRFWLW